MSFDLIRARSEMNHLFVHLNLCIALALGLVVFVTGIENAANNEASIVYIIVYMIICKHLEWL